MPQQGMAVSNHTTKLPGYAPYLPLWPCPAFQAIDPTSEHRHNPCDFHFALHSCHMQNPTAMHTQNVCSLPLLAFLLGPPDWVIISRSVAKTHSRGRYLDHYLNPSLTFCCTITTHPPPSSALSQPSPSTFCTISTISDPITHYLNHPLTTHPTAYINQYIPFCTVSTTPHTSCISQPSPPPSHPPTRSLTVGQGAMHCSMVVQLYCMPPWPALHGCKCTPLHLDPACHIRGRW
jgi:hypothetical protein